jgi:hypothetical protein
MTMPVNMEQTKKLNQYLEILELEKPYPAEQAYLKYLETNPQAQHFTKNGVIIESKSARISWLYYQIKQKKIKSLSPYLQRLLLSEVWRAEDRFKSKSYIRDIWSGLATTASFFLVPLSLVIENVVERLDDSTISDDIKNQLSQLLTKLNEYKTDKVEYINLDGQTRSLEAIVPYIDGDFNLNTSKMKDAVSVLDPLTGRYKNIGNKNFKELDAIQQGKFLQTIIWINILQAGNLDSITRALISLNSNEKWTNWQQVYHGSWLTSFPARIHEVIDAGQGGPIRDFIRTYMSGDKKYNENVAGFEFFIAQLLYFLDTLTAGDIKELEPMFNGTKPSPSTKTSEKLKKYLKELVDNHNNPKNKLSPQTIMDWVIFRSALDNANNKNQSFYFNLNPPDIDILSPKEMWIWFDLAIKKLNVKWISKKNGTYNTESYIMTTNNKGKQVLTTIQDSWASHKSGGWKTLSISGRIDILIDKLNAESPILIKDNVIANKGISMPSMNTLIAITNSTDNYGNKIDYTSAEAADLEKGHKTSRKNKGDNDTTNLAPQKKSSNRDYSGTNMIDTTKVKKATKKKK